MAAGAAGGVPGQQVRIQLSTQHQDLSLPQDTGAILVPTSLRRQDLGTLVNDLLATDSRIAFDFFIDGLPLRTTLDQWLTTHQASTEATLSVEYARAQSPPQHQASFPHDDCIGAVDVLSVSSPANVSDDVRPGHERILSGSFDGCVRVWSPSGVALAASEGAGPPDQFGNRALADGRMPFLHAARFLSPTKIVAGGWRMYLRVWDYAQGDAALSADSATLQPALDLHGHTMPVNALAVHPSSQRILSASDDATARLWTADPATAPDADAALLASTGSNKRRKLSASAPATRGPLAVLAAHKGPVKAAVFHAHDASAAYTASADSTLLTWDLETGRSVSSRTPGGPHAPLRALAPLPDIGLLAVGTLDRRVLLVDPRAGAVRSSVGALRGHRNALTALAPEPGAPHGLASASFDGCVRVWDVRAARDPVAGKGAPGSTFKIPRAGVGEGCDRREGGEGVRLHALAWDEAVGIVSAGEDRMLQIDRVSRPQS